MPLKATLDIVLQGYAVTLKKRHAMTKMVPLHPALQSPMEAALAQTVRKVWILRRLRWILYYALLRLCNGGDLF